MDDLNEIVLVLSLLFNLLLLGYFLIGGKEEGNGSHRNIEMILDKLKALDFHSSNTTDYLKKTNSTLKTLQEKLNDISSKLETKKRNRKKL